MQATGPGWPVLQGRQLVNGTSGATLVTEPAGGPVPKRGLWAAMTGRWVRSGGSTGEGGGTAAPRAGAAGLPPPPCMRPACRAAGHGGAQLGVQGKKKRSRGGAVGRAAAPRAGATGPPTRPTSCMATRTALGKKGKMAME